MLKIPPGQEREGVKIKCSKCNRHVNETCRLTGEERSACKFKSKQKYNLVVHVPGTDDDRRFKIIDAKTFHEALVQRDKFKEELEARGYHKETIQREKLKTDLQSLTIEYIDASSGEHQIELLNRKRSKSHINTSTNVLTRFSDCMKKKGYIISNLDVKDIGIYEANDFLLYLRQLSDSEHLHNKHMVVMKTFFNWINNKRGYKIDNPFVSAELIFETGKHTEIIEKHEFEALLKVVTPENGYHEFANQNAKEKGKHLYRDYLITSFKMALETGCRGEELAVLKWSHLKAVSDKAEVFHIDNLKVAKMKKNKKEYKRPIPITASLRKLLIELGYDEKKGRDEYVIPRAASVSETTMFKSIGRAFNHYIKLVDTRGRKIEFKDLRNTYITYLSLALGPKAKTFTGHADGKVIENHYLAKEFIAGQLTDFNMFEEEKTKTKGT